ncbi:hypothetical protein Zmor_003448 [Zophobas morio]|uniref:Uncharacterized protein n=1 Tax=Zophobas morio TaxID=2755281 RepID=A0AA38M2M8_9CUCU|nr:hypothetical protein Zmor_003448 [Zophobas morio]
MSKHKHEKKTNVINRTTSETLRLGEAELRVLPPANPQAARKKIQNSSSSFQITGVSMTRTDGDDSADDLDTDDISRVTDNETPSFSEDSRDTDDHQLDAPAPAEPQAEVKQKPPDERFKIVKIPSAAPFSRGRWICVDYFDDATEKGPKRLDNAARSAMVQEQAYTSPHYTTIQQNFSFVGTKPAGSAKGFPQGYSSILTSEGLEPADFVSRENIAQYNQKAATQPSNVNGQKDDILSDIKVALTSMPASNSGSAPNNNNIDRKIEEALDAVKTHLMVAVHKEVDFLKTRVSTLEGRVNELEIENSILRVNYLLFKS